MNQQAHECEGCKAGLTLLAGSHWNGMKAVSVCTKDDPQPPEPTYTRADLYKAAQLGEDFAAGTAATVEYDTIEQMIDDHFNPTKPNA